MAMNEFGAGFTLWADDQASKTIDHVGKRFDEFAGAAQRAAALIGGGMVAAGVAIGRGLGRAMDHAAAFETAVAEVSTLITEEAFPEAKIRAAAQNAALLYGTEAQQNAKALYQIISAGITDAAAAQKTMDAANRLAVGGLTDTRIAADGLTNVLLSYRDKQLDVNDVNDAFFTAIKAGKTTADEIAGSIGRVASGANVLGVSMDELLGSIATVTQSGIQTSEAVSGLKAAFALLNKPQAEATKEAKRLGIEYSAAAVRAQGWEAWLGKITSAQGFNTDSMSKLFGSIEAYNTMVALTSNSGKTFNDVMGQMRNRAGATDAAVAKMSATMEHQRKVLDQSVKGIQEAFGGAGNELLAPMVGVIGKLAGAFAQLSSAIPPEARKAIVAVIGGLAGLLTGVGGIGLLVGGMSLLGVSLTTVAAAFGAIVAVMIPLSILTAGFGIAIVAAFRAITKHVGSAGDTWQDTMRKIKLGWSGLVDLIRDGKISDAVQAELGKAENQGVGAFLARAEGWLQRLSAFWTGLKNGFDRGLGALGPSIDKLLEKIGVIGDTLGGDATDGLASATAAGDRAGVILSKLGEYGIAAMTALVDLGQRLAEKLGDVSSQDIADGIYSFVAAFRTLAAVVGPLFAFMGWWSENVIVPTITRLGLIADTFFRVRDGISEVIKGFKELWDTIASGPGGFIDRLGLGFEKLKGRAEPVASGIAGNYAQFYGLDGIGGTDAAPDIQSIAQSQTVPPVVEQLPFGQALRANMGLNQSGGGAEIIRNMARITAEENHKYLNKRPPQKVEATITVTEMARGEALVKERADSRGYGGDIVPQGGF